MSGSSDDPPTVTVPLEYAPSPSRRRRRFIRFALIAVLIVVALVAYAQRWRLRVYEQFASVAWVHWRGLHASDGASVVVYEEDPVAAKRLIASSGYTSLPNGAAGQNSPKWDAVLAAMGTRRFYLPQQPTGGTVFLHERRTPSGRRLLVHATYAPSTSGNGVSDGQLTVLILGIDTLSGTESQLGGKGEDDFFLFHSLAPDGRGAYPHPQEHKVRIFAGQPDPADATRFWFDYEIDGKRARTTMQIRDPYTKDELPNWPADWPRVDVVLPPSDGATK